MTVPAIAALNESSPSGSDNISAGDNRIREHKTQVRQILEKDHDYPSSGQSASAGQHKKLTLQEQANLGTGAVGTTILGNQAGKLVYTDEADNDVTIIDETSGKLGVSTIDMVAKSLAVTETTNSACGFVPIGCPIPWLKTLTGVPALPANFVECNGQVLSDAASALNGQTIPDLNAGNVVLTGNSTSGGTSSDINAAHTHTTPDHTHDLIHNTTAGGRSSLETADGDDTESSAFSVSSGGDTTGSTGAAISYDVVYIIRIK